MATAHRALGDEVRLGVVESLWVCDRTPSELRTLTGLDWNLLSFHLNVLEDAGLVTRRRSDGDGRRRYVGLANGVELPLVRPAAAMPPRPRTLFFCTHNAARSQFAAALWRGATGLAAASAGSDPAPAVHPQTVAVAAAHGLDLSRARPRQIPSSASFDLVVSVCDRARESTPFDAPAALHWSVPDPIAGTREEFEAVFADIKNRVDRLAAMAA